FPAAPPRPAPIAVPTPGATRLPSAPPRSEPIPPPIPPPPLSVAAARPYVGLRNDAPSPTLTFVSGDDFSAEWYELRNDRIIGLPPSMPVFRFSSESAVQYDAWSGVNVRVSACVPEKRPPPTFPASLG